MSDPHTRLAVVTPVTRGDGLSSLSRAGYERMKDAAALFFVMAESGDAADRRVDHRVFSTLGTVLTVKASSPGALFNKAVERIGQAGLIFLPEGAWMEVETMMGIRRMLDAGIWGGWCRPRFYGTGWWARPIEGWLLSQAWLNGTAVWDCGLFIHRKMFYALGRFDEESIYPAAGLAQRLRVGRGSVLRDEVFLNISVWMRDGPRRFLQSAGSVAREAGGFCRFVWRCLRPSTRA